MLNPRPIRAIRTRYYPATNTKPSHVQATTDTGHRVQVSAWLFDDYEEAHYAAARELAYKLKWGEFQGAGVYAKDYYWVLKNKSGI